MSDRTTIPWTDATWSPVTGCSKVSAGCANCYISRTPPFRKAHRRFERVGNSMTTGVQLHPDRLDQPLRWRRPRRIFVCSMSDLFHPQVPNNFLLAIWAIMESVPQHTFQVLTKRPERMHSLLGTERSPDKPAEPVYERRPIPGYLDYYADTEGGIWSSRRGGMRLLSPGVITKWGHLHVAIHDGCGNRRQEKVHRLILMAFDRPPLKGEESRHLDGDPTNNRITNLQWGSRAENSADRTRHGHAVTAPHLTIGQVAEVRIAALEGEAHRAIGRRFGVSHTQVARIVNGESWGFKVLPNVWLGCSVENQYWADRRIPLLLQTPAAVRFLSLEPLLKRLFLKHEWLTGRMKPVSMSGAYTGFPPGRTIGGGERVGWTIVGGESGPRHRPMETAWVRDIADQCVAAGVPLFVKQDAGAKPGQQGRLPDDLWALKQFPVPPPPKPSGKGTTIV